MNFARPTLVAAVCIFMSGCVNLAPKYNQPDAPIANTWPTEQAGNSTATPAYELGWKEFYGDTKLHQLIELALNNNRTLQQSALAVELARAQFKIAKADILPDIDANTNATILRTNNDTSVTTARL